MPRNSTPLPILRSQSDNRDRQTEFLTQIPHHVFPCFLNQNPRSPFLSPSGELGALITLHHSHHSSPSTDHFFTPQRGKSISSRQRLEDIDKNDYWRNCEVVELSLGKHAPNRHTFFKTNSFSPWMRKGTKRIKADQPFDRKLWISHAAKLNSSPDPPITIG